jgi:NAD-dependent dihydropyrimidine dehydrogenase PreA subunit
VTVSDPDPTRKLLTWLGAMDPPPVVLLVCGHATPPRAGADVAAIQLRGCVNDEGIGLPAQLLAFGVSQVKAVRCPLEAAATEATVAEWSRVLSGVGVFEETGRRRPRQGAVFDLASPALPRRLAFGLLPTRRPPFDVDLDAPGREAAALRFLSEHGRARLPEPGETVHSAGARTADGDQAANGGLAGSGSAPAVAVSLLASGCDGCGVCVRACPVQALELRHEGNTSVLSHVVARCRADLSCVRLCPRNALVVEKELTVVDIARQERVELAVIATASCSRCGARHPVAEGAMCRVCQFRSANAFGSLPVAASRPHQAQSPARSQG